MYLTTSVLNGEHDVTVLALLVEITRKYDVKFKITIKCNFMTYDTCEKAILITFSFDWHKLASLIMQ